MLAGLIRYVHEDWPSWSKVWDRGLAALSYLVVALIVTWPLVKTASTQVVVGTEPADTVPHFNAWTIWWNADRATVGFANYWDSPIFYPAKNTFAFSEPQPATLLVAPVLWLTDSRALAMNVYLWLSLALNGWFTERFLRSTGMRLGIAIGGGVSMLLLPLVHWQIGVIQLVPMWGTVWLWWAFLRLLQQDGSATWKTTNLTGLEIGLAMAACWYCCVHHGLSLALLMSIGGWLLGRKLLSLKYWSALAISVISFAILCGPMLWHLGSMAENEEFQRAKETVAGLSTIPGDYLSVYGHSLFDLHNPFGRPGWLMSPGPGKLLLASVGLIAGFGAGRRHFTSFFLIIAVTSFLMSLGDNLQILGWKPWWFLVEHVPGFAQVRNVFRFGYFFQAAVVCLATSAVDILWRYASSLPTGPHFAIVLKLVIIIFAGYAWLDPLPPRPGITPMHYSLSQPAWIGELAMQHENKAGGVLCLPMASGNGVEDYEVTTKWMLAGTYHHAPLANGYSGFFPESYFVRRSQVQSSGMQGDVLKQCIVDGIFWIVIDRKRYNTWWGDSQTIGLVRTIRTFGDGSDVDLYRLELANSGNQGQ